jgi:signal transduction histidine kinase/CheY-like chemotaxis protein
MRGLRDKAWGYLFAMTTVAFATVARLTIIDPVLEGRVPLPAYFAAVIASVWFGGVGPAILASVLGYVAVLILFPDTEHAPPTAAAHVVIALSYGFVCASFIIFAEGLRRARARAEMLAKEAKRGQAALAESDRRKDEFLATLAHELRNPLAPIRSGLDVIEHPSAPPALLEKTFRIMDRQVAYLVRLVDDLTDVSRFMSGKIGLRKQWILLESVVADALEMVRLSIEEAGVDLRVELPGEPVWIYVDPTRLAQVLANLLNNSAKFTHPGGFIRLRAAVESTRAEGDRLVLSVQDNGVGISAEMVPKVFDLFVQERAASGAKATGLGIGLHLVRSLVSLHGGSAEARSEGPGRGSEFVVRLPVALDAPPRCPELERAPKLQVVVPPPSAHRLLVVDDNRDVADGLAEVLRLLGHEVRVANDGPSALTVEEAFHPDLVLLDIGLPGMDGYEVARRLRKKSEAHRPLLVAVTGWGQDEDRHRSFEAGFDVHLVKPLDVPVLEKLLDQKLPSQL